MRGVMLFLYITVHHGTASGTHHKGSGAPAVVDLNSFLLNVFLGPQRPQNLFSLHSLIAVLLQWSSHLGLRLLLPPRVTSAPRGQPPWLLPLAVALFTSLRPRLDITHAR